MSASSSLPSPSLFLSLLPSPRTTGGWQRADGRGRAAGAGSGRRGRNCHWRRVVQVQHGLRRLRHGGAARVVDVGGREHDGRRARLAPVPAHVAAERLPHGELDPAHAAHSWMRALSLSAAAAAGSLSSFACSRVWLVRCPPSPWSDGNDLLHVLHSNTPSAPSALLPAGVDDDVGAIDVATRVTTVRAARWRAPAPPGDEQPRRLGARCGG
uniref:Uncharacterized protein n=1 Tax=Oryza glaberrima TaxID=4538 RepID=I1QPY2_ORYGL